MDRPGSAILTLYADYFSPETRTMLTIIHLGRINFEFHEVDTFKGEHKAKDFLLINPTGLVPTITEGRTMVLAGYLQYLKYLVGHHKGLRDKLYPEALR